MSGIVQKDSNGIEFKNIELEQFDYFESDTINSELRRYDKRIGSLLICFSQLEQALDEAISYLISERSHHEGLTIIMGLGYSQKVALFERLCRPYLIINDKKAELPKLKTHVDEFRAAGQIRNIVAHARWMTLEKDGFVRSKSSQNEDALVQFKYYKLTPGILYTQQRRINKRITDFYEFIEKNGLV